MSGFEVDPGGDMTVTYGARTVLDTSGNLIMGLPGASEYIATIPVAFPDFTKDWLYHWRWQTSYVAGSNGQTYNLSEYGDAYITAPPQEWSATTVLATAPAGTNFVVNKVRLNRTTAPANTWGIAAQTINVKVPQNKWTPYSGSILVEAELFMARAMSLYVSGGQLILHRQQSISTGPGFAINSVYNTMYYGATSTGVPNTSDPADTYVYQGAEWAYGSQVGNIVYANATGNNTTQVHYSASQAPFIPQNYRWATGNASVGGSAVSVTDATNYASTYTVDVAVEFCRAT